MDYLVEVRELSPRDNCDSRELGPHSRESYPLDEQPGLWAVEARVKSPGCRDGSCSGEAIRIGAWGGARVKSPTRGRNGLGRTGWRRGWGAPLPCRGGADALRALDSRAGWSSAGSRSRGQSPSVARDAGTAVVAEPLDGLRQPVHRAEPVFDGGDQEVAHVVTGDPGGGAEVAHRIGAAFKGERDADPLAVVAADLEAAEHRRVLRSGTATCPSWRRSAPPAGRARRRPWAMRSVMLLALAGGRPCPVSQGAASLSHPLLNAAAWHSP